MEERTARALKNGATSAQAVMNEVRQGVLNPYSAARRIIEDRRAVAELLGQTDAAREAE